jgi:hypothetical protein
MKPKEHLDNYAANFMNMNDNNITLTPVSKFSREKQAQLNANTAISVLQEDGTIAYLDPNPIVTALYLAKKLHEQPESADVPGFSVKLDPKAYQQISRALKPQGRYDKRNWQLLKSIKGCHRFFRDMDNGRIGVADQSADGDAGYGRVYIGWPHKTDDGTLYLDTRRPITFFKKYNSGTHYSIPLQHPDGKHTRTVGTKAEADYCVETFGMYMIEEGK